MFAQQLESCKVYQMEGNDSTTIKQVAMRVVTPSGKLSAEYFNQYKENLRDSAFSYADFYTYRDTLLIQKTRAEENGDSLKWMYFYNVGRFKIREAFYKYTFHPIENIPMNGSSNPPESFEKARSWRLIQDKNYKVDASGKILESSSQFYENPDVEKLVYEYDTSNRINTILTYQSGRLQNISNYQYQKNSYTITSKEIKNDNEKGVDTSGFVVTCQQDDFNRCIAVMKIFKDTANGKYMQYFTYGDNRLIREENIFQFTKDGKEGLEKLTHLLIYEY